MRIVHLLDPGGGGGDGDGCGDEAMLCCAAAMGIVQAEGAEFRHDAWLIGDTHAERRAWDLGVRTTDRVTARRRSAFPGCAPSRRPTVRALARLRRARFGGDDPSCFLDIVQCYSLPAA